MTKKNKDEFEQATREATGFRRNMIEATRLTDVRYDAATDSLGLEVLGIKGETVNCSALRTPEGRADARQAPNDLADIVAPLPDPSLGVSTDILRDLAHDRAEIRATTSNLTERAIRTCNGNTPKPGRQ
jgi:hypothetical protein